MTLELFNKNAIIFPAEIDNDAKLKYDFTRLNNYDDIITKIINSNNITFKDIDCFITFNRLSNSGLISTIANIFNKDILYINPLTGFPAFGKRKLNYKLKYALWLDTLHHDIELFNGLEKLAKRGLRISNLYTLIDCHEGVSLFINEVLPNVKLITIYELYDLMSFYESKDLLTNFIIEKCKFIADKNRKLTIQYIEEFSKLRNGLFDYMINPEKWYIQNYICFNKLHVSTMHYKSITLNYTSNYEWVNIKKEIICYNSFINNIIISPERINGLNLEELLQLQNKYKFNVIEFNPYFKLLDTFKLNIVNNYIKSNNISSIYDGIIYSINLSILLNKKKKDELYKTLSLITNKVLLYINVDDDLRLLQELIIYSNEYMNSVIQGIIMDYEQVKNITFDKKLVLHNLVPLILNVNEITDDMNKYYSNNHYHSLLLSLNVIPLQNRKQKELRQLYTNELTGTYDTVNKYLVSQDNTDDRDNMREYIRNHKFALEKHIKKSVNTQYQSKLVSYISPIAWYRYLLGSK
jgi:hypothetical protein